MNRYLFFICCWLALPSYAQEVKEIKHLNNALIFNVSHTTQLPAADLAKRFGQSFDIGGQLEYMSGKRNWIIGLDAGYFFGKTVKEDVLKNLRSPTGDLFGINFTFASVVLRQRGWHSGLVLGRLFSLSKKNPRSGIRATIGLGWMQHRIRIQDDNDSFAQTVGDYRKGYDRLTGGLMLSQFLGYQLLSRNRTVNFYIGVEAIQGFTKSQRSYNYDTRMADTASRLDVLLGLKVGWALPLYVVRNADEIYY